MQLRNIWDALYPPFDPRSINVGVAHEKVMRRIDAGRRFHKRRKFINRWRQISAVIVVPLLAISIWFAVSSRFGVNQGEVVQEIYAPLGMRVRVALPDSSEVWLNSGSVLKYSNTFRKGNRRVELIGEAFFRVVSDPSDPFRAVFSDVTATATGTAFNIEAYPQDSVTAVTLLEGNLDVEWGKNNVALLPRERLQIDAAGYDVYVGDPYKWYSWKDGVIAFRNDPLWFVFDRLGRIHNVRFEIKDECINDKIHYATFRSESLNQIMELMEKSACLRFVKTNNEDDDRQTIEVYDNKKKS